MPIVGRCKLARDPRLGIVLGYVPIEQLCEKRLYQAMYQAYPHRVPITDPIGPHLTAPGTPIKSEPPPAARVLLPLFTRRKFPKLVLLQLGLVYLGLVLEYSVCIMFLF